MQDHSQLGRYISEASLLALGPPRRHVSNRTRRTLPCTKLRSGGCVVLRDGVLDCNKRKRVGRPFLGDDGGISLSLIRHYLTDPRRLGEWLIGNLYSKTGVK